MVHKVRILNNLRKESTVSGLALFAFSQLTEAPCVCVSQAI